MSFRLVESGRFAGFENYTPVVPASFLSGGREIGPLPVELDTGAAISVAPPSLAKDLGIDIEAGQPVSLKGVGGSVDSYVHPLDIEIGGQMFPSIPVAITTRGDSPFLLGRLGFLQEARVSFEPEGTVTVKARDQILTVNQVQPGAVASDALKALVAFAVFAVAVGGYFFLTRQRYD